jgi:two-component system response regulator
MEHKVILRVEDNPRDEALTLRALKNHIANEIIVARDGVEALDYRLDGGFMPTAI